MCAGWRESGCISIYYPLNGPSKDYEETKRKAINNKINNKNNIVLVEILYYSLFHETKTKKKKKYLFSSLKNKNNIMLAKLLYCSLFH